MELLKGVRPADYLLTATMVALGAALGVANVVAGPDADLAHAQDSQSVLIVPVFVLAALPVLWRRRNVLAAVAASFVVVALSVPAFGWITRCGFALPLSFVLSYAVARFAGGRQNQVLGLVGILALQLVTLVMDSSTGGLGALPLSVPIAALVYAVGLFVRSRAAKASAAPTLSLEHAQA